MLSKSTAIQLEIDPYIAQHQFVDVITLHTIIILEYYIFLYHATCPIHPKYQAQC